MGYTYSTHELVIFIFKIDSPLPPRVLSLTLSYFLCIIYTISLRGFQLESSHANRGRARILGFTNGGNDDGFSFVPYVTHSCSFCGHTQLAKPFKKCVQLICTRVLRPVSGIHILMLLLFLKRPWKDIIYLSLSIDCNLLCLFYNVYCVAFCCAMTTSSPGIHSRRCSFIYNCANYRGGENRFLRNPLMLATLSLRISFLSIDPIRSSFLCN